MAGDDGNFTEEIKVPKDFSGQVVIDREGYREVHVIKEGKEIQQYNMQTYPDGSAIRPEDSFVVEHSAPQEQVFDILIYK